LLLVVLPILVSACVAQSDAVNPAPTLTPLPDGPNVFGVGEKITYEDGFSITVLAIEDPVADNAGAVVSPELGIVLVAIEVEACAAQRTAAASINPLDFSLALDNNTSAEHSYRFLREPALHSATLVPGECLRGWITFEKFGEPTLLHVVVDPIEHPTVTVRCYLECHQMAPTEVLPTTLE
jgi:hypothetical protein